MMESDGPIGSWFSEHSLPKAEPKPEDKLPEAPFNGTVIARDVVNVSTSRGNDGQSWGYPGYLRAKVTLAILRDDDPADKPVVVIHSFVTGEEAEPKCLIRKGHKVKCRSVARLSSMSSSIVAKEIDFDLSQIATNTPNPPNPVESFDT